MGYWSREGYFDSICDQNTMLLRRMTIESSQGEGIVLFVLASCTRSAAKHIWTLIVTQRIERVLGKPCT